MTKYESESVINFWGGIESCKQLISSYNNAPDEIKSKVEENYKISKIIDALELIK